MHATNAKLNATGAARCMVRFPLRSLRGNSRPQREIIATGAASNNRSLLRSFSSCAWFFYRLAAPLGFNRNYIRVIYNSQVKTNIPLRASARNNHTSASASPFVSAKGGEVGSAVYHASRLFNPLFTYPIHHSFHLTHTIRSAPFSFISCPILPAT